MLIKIWIKNFLLFSLIIIIIIEDDVKEWRVSIHSFFVPLSFWHQPSIHPHTYTHKVESFFWKILFSVLCFLLLLPKFRQTIFNKILLTKFGHFQQRIIIRMMMMIITIHGLNFNRKKKIQFESSLFVCLFDEHNSKVFPFIEWKRKPETNKAPSKVCVCVCELPISNFVRRQYLKGK